jgi:hypothetical protein
MRWRGVLALAAIVIAAIAATAGFFFFRDNFSTHYPIKVLTAQSLRALEIPWWNFADSGGQPLAGNPNTLTFYPDNILYLLLPAHVAFNLHFLIHIAAAFLAMRSLTRSWFGGALYALSGVAISATSFYNLVVALAMVPLAMLAAERRSPLVLGAAFGLMLLAAEPVTLIGAALTVAVVAFGRITIRDLGVAVAVALVIGSPQIIAFAEIARDVERSMGMSAVATLAASLHPSRLLEIIWPFGPVLNEPGGDRVRLFSTIFLGLIAIPALFRKSRYVAIVLLMAFLAIGRFNPVIASLVEAVSSLRIMRFPEKFAVPLIASLVVLCAAYFHERSVRWQRVWAAVTFVPLMWVLWRALPIDWYSHYRVETVKAAGRVHRPSTVPAGVLPARAEYRLRARALEPLFGAVAGLRYAIHPSPDRMHSLRTRMVVERFAIGRDRVRARYLRINGGEVPGSLPAAMFVSRVIPARDIFEEASIMESPAFNEQTTAVTPLAMPVAPGRVLSYGQEGQTIRIEVEAAGPALLFVNQTWFGAWRATAQGEDLKTTPVDIDRLGVIVPAGRSTVLLRFGRNRFAVIVAWLLSSALLVAVAFAKRIEKGDGRAGEIERPGDDNGTVGDVERSPYGRFRLWKRLAANTHL